MKKILVTLAALGLVAGYAATAHATNGYFSHAYSIKNKGMAGAGVAAPMDAMVPSTNPAGLTEVGNRLDLGLTIFNPNREYTVNRDADLPSLGAGYFELAGGTVESDSDYFFIPNLGWSKQLNDNSAVGVAVYGNGGMNTDYPTQTFYDPTHHATGVDLMQLFIAPTYAYKFNEMHSIGITPIIAAQFFEAKGVYSFAVVSSATDKLSGNGHDSSFGFGGRIGYLGKLTEQFSVGLAYQSKIYMDEFDDYAGLFAEQGDFDIPSNWTVGFAVKPIPTVTLAFDIQQIYYSDIKSIAYNMMPALALAWPPSSNENYYLGTNNGAGFGWDDMTVYKIGLQWDRTKQWSYRFGYSYGEQPIVESMNPMESSATFNILAPGVIEQHATFGFTYTFANGSELDFSLTHAFSNDVTGINPLANNDPDNDPAGSPQTVTLTMDQWEVGIGYSWKF
jgi:long-chain fatty acid transport protein